MAEYRLSPAAVRDLEAIWRYTFHKWGGKQADRYADLLTQAFTELAQSPATAPICDHTICSATKRYNWPIQM